MQPINISKICMLVGDHMGFWHLAIG